MFSDVKLFAKVLKKHEKNFFVKLGVVLCDNEVI